MTERGRRTEKRAKGGGEEIRIRRPTLQGREGVEQKVREPQAGNRVQSGEPIGAHKDCSMKVKV